MLLSQSSLCERMCGPIALNPKPSTLNPQGAVMDQFRIKDAGTLG